MSYAHPNPTDDREHEHRHAHTDDHDDHDERHPALTPLVIDVIADQTRAELEASIDEPLTGERNREGGNHHSHTVGAVGAGRTFHTNGELLAEFREESTSRTDATTAAHSGGHHD